jgi:iron(II)-dependent oxidoreductase
MDEGAQSSRSNENSISAPPEKALSRIRIALKQEHPASPIPPLASDVPGDGKNTKTATMLEKENPRPETRKSLTGSRTWLAATLIVLLGALGYYLINSERKRDKREPERPGPNAQTETFPGLTHAGRNAQGCEEYTLDKDPSVILIRIPGDTFMMGSTEDDADPDEKPLTRVTLDSYFIGKYEITRAQFRRFCAKSGRVEPEPPPWATDENHPMVNVTWHDAMPSEEEKVILAYCEWAGLRLPTEAEWEFAARGPEGRKWPWGDVVPADSDRLANMDGIEDGYEFTAPKGSFPGGVGPFGTHDQAGNVWEWCSDWYAEKLPGGSVSKLWGPPSGSRRVVRGGGWSSSVRVLRGSNRNENTPISRFGFIGFRVAL